MRCPNCQVDGTDLPNLPWEPMASDQVVPVIDLAIGARRKRRGRTCQNSPILWKTTYRCVYLLQYKAPNLNLLGPQSPCWDPLEQESLRTGADISPRDLGPAHDGLASTPCVAAQPHTRAIDSPRTFDWWFSSQGRAQIVTTHVLFDASSRASCLICGNES